MSAKVYVSDRRETGIKIDRKRVGRTERQEERDKLVTLVKRMDTGSNFMAKKTIRRITTDNVADLPQLY